MVDNADASCSNLQLGQSAQLASAASPPRMLVGMSGGPEGWGPGHLGAHGRVSGRVFIYAWNVRRFRDRFD